MFNFLTMYNAKVLNATFPTVIIMYVMHQKKYLDMDSIAIRNEVMQNTQTLITEEHPSNSAHCRPGQAYFVPP